MKVAVLLCGHMRTYKKTFRLLINNLLGLYDTDLFIITYDRTENIKGSRTFTSNRFSQKEAIVYGKFLKRIIIIDENKFKKEHNLKVDDKFKFKFKNVISRLYRMSILIHKGGQMIRQYANQHKIKYDLIIKLRPDIILEKPLNMINVDFTKINFPSIDSGFGGNDHIVIGTPANMKFFFDFGHSMNRLNEKFNIDISIVENSIMKHLQICNIKTYRNKELNNYKILRQPKSVRK